MNGDVGEVESAAHTLFFKGKVVEVDRVLLSFYIDVHVTSMLLNDVAFIFATVHKREDAGCTAQRNIVLRGVSPGYNCDLLFHNGGWCSPLVESRFLLYFCIPLR